MTRRKVHSPKLIHYYAKASTTSLTRSRVSKFCELFCELTSLGNRFFVFSESHLTTSTLDFQLRFCLPKLLDDEGDFLLSLISGSSMTPMN